MIEKTNLVVFELDNVRKKKRDCRNVKILICKKASFYQFQTKFGNMVNSNKSNLKEEKRLAEEVPLSI